MQYRVTKQYGRGAETTCQQFRDLPTAKSYLQQHSESDAAMKINVIYRLYDDLDVVLQTVDTSALDLSSMRSAEAGNAAGSQGKTSSATFKPTPFEMAPRPKGTAPHWIVDKNDKDDKDDKDDKEGKE